MEYNSKYIITEIEKEYRQPENLVTIRNCSDLDLEEKVREGHQLLFGVTWRDPMQAACERYQDAMEKRLAALGFGCKFKAFPFPDEEINEVATILKELSVHFDADLDVDRMIRKLNIRRPKGETYFLVVTTVLIPIISIAPEEK